MMMNRKNNIIKVFNYNIGEDIIAFSTLRGEGIDAESPYDGFSICDYTGDDGKKVSLCRQSLCDYLGIPPQNLIIPRQTHSDTVAVIDNVPQGNITGVDSLITRLADTALAINTADCVPVLLADTTTGLISAIHAGWRGIVSEIIPKTVTEAKGLGAKDFKAVIGPAICSECFETSDEIAEKFRTKFGNCVITTNALTGKKHVDLVQSAKIQLLYTGIKEENITISDKCTRCNYTELFSARKSGVNSGRVATVIMRKNKS